MCGIVGFVGRRDAAPILLEGLSKLEYRGYDSAGIAVRDGEKEAEVVKTVGRLKNLEEKTFIAHDHEEFLDIAENKPGFIKAMWCGDSACEDKLKDETGGVKSRCIPFIEEQLGDKCVCCGKPAKQMVYWGRQY